MVGLSGSRSDSSLSFGETRERLELNHLNSRNFVRATSKKRHSGGLETLKHYNKLSISPPQARKKMGQKTYEMAKTYEITGYCLLWSKSLCTAEGTEYARPYCVFSVCGPPQAEKIAVLHFANTIFIKKIDVSRAQSPKISRPSGQKLWLLARRARKIGIST